MAAKNSSMPFGFSTRRWNIDVPHWGSTPTEGARVETANVVVLSSLRRGRKVVVHRDNERRLTL